MISTMRSSCSVIGALLKKDLVSFFREFWGKFVDTGFILFTNLVVFGYFMPALNQNMNYAAFLLFGAVASFGLFDITGKVGMFIADIEGDRTISYTLVMPLSTSWMVFFYMALYWAIYSMIICVVMIPFGKLILLSKLDLLAVNYPKFILMLISASFFYGCLGVWISSVIRNMRSIGILYTRILTPLFMFGAYFYSWYGISKISPVLAKVSLINPMVYIMEGVRSAGLGPEGFLPYWVSFAAIWGFNIVLFFTGASKLKKRLDCV